VAFAGLASAENRPLFPLKSGTYISGNQRGQTPTSQETNEARSMKPFLLVVAYGWSLERCYAAGTVATRKILIGNP